MKLLLIIAALTLSSQMSFAQDDYDFERQKQEQEDAAREAQMMQDQEAPVEPMEPVEEPQGSLQDTYEQPEFID